MLARVLEPEVMDSPVEALDYDQMDHRAVNQLFVADLLAQWPSIPGDDDASPELLDIGTGTAQIPIALCREETTCRIMAIDLAVAMLHQGRVNVEVAGFADRIRLDRIDAKQLPYADGSFAVVMSNSIVHHIPEPIAVLREAYRVVAADGLLFVRDLLRPADEATLAHQVATYTQGANDRQRQLFDQSLRAALSLEEIRALARQIGIDAAAVQATSDRHWTLAARKPPAA